MEPGQIRHTLYHSRELSVASISLGPCSRRMRCPAGSPPGRNYWRRAYPSAGFASLSAMARYGQCSTASTHPRLPRPWSATARSRRGISRAQRKRRGPGGDLAGRRLLKVAAALAATSSLSVGSHRSAAQVHGLGLVRSGAAELVHLTRSRADRGSRTGRPGIRVHQAELPPEHVTNCRGVPVTSVGRTVVDLARALPFPEGVAVADSALPAGQTTPDELAAVLARCARWPGSQRARRVAAFSDPLAESVLESISRAAFREQGLPPRASGGGGR